MAATIDNVRRRKSGVTGNNLGGAINASEVSNNVVNNIWRKITEVETQTGITIFRGFYLYNNHATEPIKNIILYFSTPVTNSGLEISLAQGTSALSSTSVEPTIATETTIPAILNNLWYANPTSRSEGLAINGDINPGAHAFVWMRMVVPSGTQASVFTHYRLRVEAFNNEAAGNIPEDWGICLGANMNCTADCIQAYSNISKRDIHFFQTCGNNSVGGDNPACFITNLKNEGLRPKTKICLGYTDETSTSGGSASTKKNALKTEFGMTTDYYSYDVYNVHFTVMQFENLYNVGNAHYNWVKNDLETARQRPGIEWLIVVCNDNFYSTHISPFTGPLIDTEPNPSTISESLRDVYHPLFMANSVHLVLSGGSNITLVTKLLKYNAAEPGNPIPVQTDQQSYTGPGDLGSSNYTWYNKGFIDGASLFICVGTMGMSPYTSIGPFNSNGTLEYIGALEPRQSYTVLQFSNFGKQLNILRYKHTIDELTQKVVMTKILPP